MVLGVVLFLAVNVLSQTVLRGARLDLTENRLYTLTDGTRAVLAELDEPLTVRFFFSNGLSSTRSSLSWSRWWCASCSRSAVCRRC